MKDRLIELINQAELDCLEFSKIHPYEKSLTDFIADTILADGWMRPPCKVGDKVYVIFKDKIHKATIYSMNIETEQEHYLVLIKVKVFDQISMFKVFIFGKTVFFTREEAEKALQGVK